MSPARTPSAATASAARKRGRETRPAGPRGEGRARRRAPRLALLGILLVTLLAYLPSLSNGFINWDDDVYVTKNLVIRHPDQVASLVTTPVGGNLHPLTMASLALNYAIGGEDPRGYHALNLLLHLVNTGLVFVLAGLLLPGSVWAPIVTALFFGIHPTHVESVAWVAERKDVLYALFYLVALIAYLRYLMRGRIAWLAASFASFALSLASKPSAVVLPLALLVIDYVRRRPWSPRLIVEKLPFLALSLVLGLLTYVSQRAAGAVGGLGHYNVLDRVALASYGLVMYVVNLIAPFRLSALVPYPDAGRTGLPVTCYVALGLVLLAGWAAWRGRRHRLLVFAWAFFLVNVVLVLQVLAVGEAIMADRYAYVSTLGCFFALGAWLDRRRDAAAGRRGGMGDPVVWGVAVFAVVCAVLTTQRCRVWKNSDTFWTDIIDKYPRTNVNAYNNRGQYYRQTHQYDRALNDFAVALSLKEASPLVWSNRGNVFFDRDQSDSAIVNYDRALALRPTMWETLANRGSAKAKRGDYPGAVADLTRALAGDPTNVAGWENRGLTYMALKDPARALADFQRAEGINPRDDGLANEMAVALSQLGRYRESIEAYDRAIALAPNDGQYYLNRSGAWTGLGERDKALADLRKASDLGTPTAGALPAAPR